MRRVAVSLLLFGSLPVMVEEQLQVLGLFSGKAILLVDGERYTLSIGEATPEGISLISADSNEAVIRYHGQRRVLKPGTQISSDFPQPKRKLVDIHLDRNGIYRVDGIIHHFPLNFLVDTGATIIVMSSEQAKRLRIDYQRMGKTGFAETAAERVRVYLVKLDEVSVGTMVIENG